MPAVGLVGVVVGLLAAVRGMHGAAWPRGGWLLLAGQIAGAGVLCASLAAPLPGVSSQTWVAAFTVPYLLFTAGLLSLLRATSALSFGESLIDAGIVAIGAMVLGWTVLVAPSLGGGPPTAAQLTVALSYNAIDLAMLGCLMFVALAWRRRRISPSVALLAAAGAVLLTVDLWFLTRMSAIGTGAFAAGGPGQAAWQVWALLGTAALAHPSFGRGTGAPTRPPGELSP